jgi:hypothetical protein
VSPQPDDIRDLKPWAALSEVPLWLILLVVLLAAAAAAWLWWKERSRRPAVQAPAPEAPKGPSPAERLEALLRLPLTDDESTRLFHFELSEAFRLALEERFGFPATDRTTEELRRALRGIVPELGRVLSLLEACDRVKFTDYRPAESSSREAVREALALVGSWKPAPAAAASGTVMRTEGAT